MFSQESDILRKLRLIEQLKADIITSVGQIFQAMARNSEQAIVDGLASVVILCYILARRLGFDFEKVDEAVLNVINHNVKREHEAERWYGDFSEYQRYLKQKR